MTEVSIVVLFDPRAGAASVEAGSTCTPGNDGGTIYAIVPHLRTGWRCALRSITDDCMTLVPAVERRSLARIHAHEA